MKYKWTEEQIAYLTKPIPAVEAKSYLGWIVVAVFIVVAIIKFVS